MRRIGALVVAVGVAAGWAGAQEGWKEPAEASAKEFGRYVEEVPKYFVKIEMAPVKGGKFVMAPIEKEGKAKDVEVKDFWMAKTEITYDAFEFYLKDDDRTRDEQLKDQRSPEDGHLRARPSKPYEDPQKQIGYRDFPMMSVTFRNAQAYCEVLSKHTGRKYRLPTEAEFEYAARAGREKELTEAEVLREAWARENARELEVMLPNVALGMRPVPGEVGKRAANPWGLHDLLGNVGEWVLPERAGDEPAVRGGHVRKAAAALKYSSRQRFDPKWNERDPGDPKGAWWLTDGEVVGFRVVRERE